MLAAVIFIADRLTKWAVLDRLSEGESVPVLPGILHFTRVANTGAAFGLLKEHSFFLTLLTLVSILLILVLGLRRFKRASHEQTPAFLTIAGWALVLGGAAGNLYDRIRYGHVVDFLDLRVWPVFNVADSAICAGVFLVIWHIIKTVEPKR